MFTARYTRRVVPAVALLLACGGGDLLLPADGEPATIEVVEGNGQSGRVSVALADPVVGRVTDSQGRPVADASVAFVFTQDGSDATVAPDTATTDANGLAPFQVVMGTRVGASGAELRVSTAGGERTLTAPVTFTAVSADANELLLVSGDDQSAPAGAALADPLVVQVTDVFGNPIPGVPITWTPVGGGTVSEETTPTGEDGLASVTRTLGPTAGTQQTTAGAPGLAGSPVTFTHTAGAGSATVLEGVSGSGQSALVGTSLPAPLVVRARDASGNPVSGLAVAWVVGDGGGSLAPATSTTGADGLASTVWTLGPAPGVNTATAVVSGVGTVGFSATANPGTPPGLSLEVQPPASAQVGIELSRRPVVQLREPDGSPRRQPGVQVNVSVVEGGATLAGSVARNTDGEGRVEFRDLALVGPPGTYTLAFSATGYTGVSSGAIVLARAATTTVLRSDEPDPSDAGGTVLVRYEVRSSGGTPTGNVRVSSDDGASCVATVADGECSLVLTSVGTRTLTATYSGDTRFEASADTERHEVEAPPEPVLTLRTQPSGSATIGQPLARQPVVQLRDADGGDLRTANVAVTVELASGPGTLGGTLSRTTDADGRASFTDLAIGGATGTHTLRFTAPGYTPVVSDAIDVGAAPPAGTTTTITADDPDPSDPGQAVTVRYAVTSPSGTPTGSVTVSSDGGEQPCTASVADGACAITLTAPGSRTLTATYAGDGGFAGSSGTAAHIVNAPPPPPPATPSPTASSVDVDDATIVVGETTDVTVTVRDQSGAELGGVTVTLAATGTGNSIQPGSATTDGSGRARFTFSASSPGERTLTAVAGGVTLDEHPTITVGQVGTTTRITSDDPDPSDVNQAVAVTFSVTAPAGTPTGTVTVSADGGAEPCTGIVAASGDGSCSITFTTSGDRTLTATYSGDANFAPSTDDERHRVNEPPPPPPLPPSASASSIEVQDAAITVGDATNVTVLVRDANGGALQDVTVTLTASGAASTITPASAATNNEGRARFDVGAAGAGTLTLTAVAAGVTLDQHPTITVAQVGTTTRITSDNPDPSTVGAAVPVAFSVTGDGGTPPGDAVVTVSASDGSPSCTATIAQGTCNITLATAGTVTLTATYGGGGNFSGSSDDEEHVVEAPVPPEVSLLTQPSSSAAPGVPFDRQPEVELRAGDGGSLEQPNVAVTADLASNGGTLSGTRVRRTDRKGRAEFDDLAIAGPPGTYSIRFTASGFTPDTSDPVAVARAATTTAISAVEPEPSEVGQAVTVGFQVTSTGGTPSGDVTVSSETGESCAGSVAAGSCDVTLLTAGDHTLTAVYGGDAEFEGSQGTATHHVNEAPSPPPPGESTSVSSAR